MDSLTNFRNVRFATEFSEDSIDSLWSYNYKHVLKVLKFHENQDIVNFISSLKFKNIIVRDE